LEYCGHLNVSVFNQAVVEYKQLETHYLCKVAVTVCLNVLHILHVLKDI